MKVSRAIRILQETLVSAGDVNIAFCLNVEDDSELGFFYPDCASVLGSEGDADCLAFMHQDLLDVLVDECEHSELPAMIRVVSSVGEDVH